LYHFSWRSADKPAIEIQQPTFHTTDERENAKEINKFEEIFENRKRAWFIVAY